MYRKGTEEYGKAFERQADRTNELLDADSKFWQGYLDECNKAYNDRLMRFFAAVQLVDRAVASCRRIPFSKNSDEANDLTDPAT